MHWQKLLGREAIGDPVLSNVGEILCAFSIPLVPNMIWVENVLDDVRNVRCLNKGILALVGPDEIFEIRLGPGRRTAYEYDQSIKERAL